jgi:outer membrane protein OmpA-like peptidoglycan-associated protein
MRTPIPLLAAVLLALACGGVAAQVTTDPRALEQLHPPGQKAQSTGKAGPTAKPAPAPRRAAVRPKTTAAQPPAAPLEPPAPPQPLVPLAPPPLPVVPAPVSVPVRPVPAPAPPTIVADAPGAATPIQDGVRLTFGADSADLNAASDAALRALVHDATAKPGTVTTYSVTAYAAGTPEDPSTPRRLALSRALSVRSVLINAGVASIRIYVKALGATSASIADGPPDRTDIVLGSTATEAAAQPAPPVKSTP